MKAYPSFPSICKGCKNREIGCHSKCERFREEKERFNTQKMRLVQERKGESGAVDFCIESMGRIKRRAHDRKVK